MIDGSEITRVCMAGPFGADAEINGEKLRVVPDLDGGTQLAGDSIERTGPCVLALVSDIAAIDPVTGNNGDIITLLGRTFTILSIDPDGMGGAILSLEETT